MKLYVKAHDSSNSLPRFPQFWSMSVNDQDDLVNEFCDSKWFELAADDLAVHEGNEHADNFPWQVVWTDYSQGPDHFYNFATQAEAMDFVERHPDLMADFTSGWAYLRNVQK